MILHPPFIITARLMAGLEVNDSWLSIEYDKQTDEGRMQYKYCIDTPKFEHEGNDLRSGVGSGGIQEGMNDLLCFLLSDAEHYEYLQRMPEYDTDEDDYRFPANVAQWAFENQDELSMLQSEIEEEGLVEE